MQAIDIGLTALNVEWRRLEVIAENLANANTAGSTITGTYRPLELLSGPKNDFAAYLDAGTHGIDVTVLRGVAERGIVSRTASPRLVHEPGNPLADERGLVAYPAIDQAHEMTGLIQTTRVYEANVVAMNLAREMYSRALQLGSHHT